ncbi:hypothetical protein C6503_05535 [Candidatus Poribacteria bacterium]|nr:MAG: hypothetical protein C6503_05535 [Candidatus Poribacteria bacterium]
MLKIKGLILTALSLAVVGLAGCGDSTSGYGIYRSNDIVTVFIPLPDTSEIAEVKIDNKALHVDIDRDEKIAPRVIKLQGRFFPVVEPDETVEIHGQNRINDYAVIHLRAFDTKHKVSRFIKLYISKFYDFKITNSREKPEPFENSGAFRIGDKIIAYCRLQDNIDSQPKGFQVDLGGVKIKRTTATVNTHIITEDKIGERLLILEDYKIDSDKTIRGAHFLLKDLGPDETAEIKEVKTLGSRIAIAELVILAEDPQPPQFPQPPNDVIITDR